MSGQHDHVPLFDMTENHYSKINEGGLCAVLLLKFFVETVFE